MVVYHYFDFRDGPKTTYTGILLSLLYQIGSTAAYEKLQDLYRQSKQTRLSDATMRKFIIDNIPTGKRIYIVIDALDECQQGLDQSNVIRSIRDICALDSIHIFASCRYAVHNLAGNEVIYLDDRNVRDDISNVIDRAFEQEIIQFPSMKNEIKAVLMDGAKGV